VVVSWSLNRTLSKDAHSESAKLFNYLSFVTFDERPLLEGLPISLDAFRSALKSTAPQRVSGLGIRLDFHEMSPLLDFVLALDG
jgi:hypothetical protein